MVDGTSEIDDPKFFLSPDEKTNAKNELMATLDALYNESVFDDNATACKFPARKAWLSEKLSLKDLPRVACTNFDNILKRLDPQSVTLVFPSAHINSPASMFGHTFLRINSAYKSRLLSYAINYAADADPNKENATVFAIKGLFGGYYGEYSLLPYYEKLKEYRDSENRDIWEYDLDLTKDEVLKMVRHIWELNGTRSNYYFFTENCSYNMLWLIEVARPSIHLREYFNFEVIPLETLHASKQIGIISGSHYRPSKRSTLLRYEDIIKDNNIHFVRELVNIEVSIKDFQKNSNLSKQQKMYILEASIEFLEYTYTKSKITKPQYILQFHKLTKARALLGQGAVVVVETPQNPITSHRAVRISTGFGYRADNPIGYLGIRPAYHDLEDSSVGFLRGTQIEFLDMLFSYSKKNKIDVEKITIVSIVSTAQRSEFVSGFSWRMKLGWDKNYLDDKADFITTLGAGYSIGNKWAYAYGMIDPLFYIADGVTTGIGGSLGLIIDKYNFMSTNIEASYRLYHTGFNQTLINATQSFRMSQNTQLKFQYEYKDKYYANENFGENSYKVVGNYYF